MGKTESEKLRTISKDICGEIRATSKRECDEIKSISKNVCKETEKMSQNICTEIRAHAKSKKYDWGSLIASGIAAICSMVAIFVAINIPSKIAEEQNKIALFEKRYEVYCEIRAIKEFVDDYYTLCTKDSIAVVEKDEYVRLWEDKIHVDYYSNVENAGAIMKLQEQKIRSIEFIFENITEEERVLVKEFFDMYYSYTQSFVKESEVVNVTVFLNDSARISVMNKISMLMEKMEGQLSLSD